MSKEYKAILQNLHKNDYKPLYFLYGENPYYVDKIVEYIANNALSADFRDFNQQIIYSQDADIPTVVGYSRQLPNFADKRVVIYKEAQHQAKKMDLFEEYFENPNPQTILVIAMMGTNFDKRKKVYKLAAKNGVVLQSDAIRDYQMNGWISEFAKDNQINITPKAIQMLAEHVGVDQFRVENELNKIKISKGDAKIDVAEISEFVGISKEFNVFELQNALGDKDALKTTRIIQYLADDKNSALPMVMASLFNYFTKLIKLHVAPSQNPTELSKLIGVHPYILKEYDKARRNYSLKQCTRAVEHIREADMRSKGYYFDGKSLDILQELTSKILLGY